MKRKPSGKRLGCLAVINPTCSHAPVQQTGAFCYTENRQMRKGIGLLIITEIPRLGRVAVLQARGYFNTEEMRPQYYAGGCQVTVYGGINKNETPKQALIREAKEELGPAVAKMIKKAKLVRVADFRRGNESGEIYATFLNSNFLRKVCLSPDSGGLRPVKPKDLKRALDLSRFKNGVKRRDVLAVFPDTKRAIAEAFSRFGFGL